MQVHNECHEVLSCVSMSNVGPAVNVVPPVFKWKALALHSSLFDTYELYSTRVSFTPCTLFVGGVGSSVLVQDSTLILHTNGRR